jgi:carbon monoxide dehydrogenase subunit G
MTIQSEIQIAADVERVWDLTVDVERWPTLTPTITSVERLEPGAMQVGSTARIKQPGQRPAVWTVTVCDEPKLFEWQTKSMGVTVVGRHQLEPTATGCRNTLSVDITGFGSGLMMRLVRRRLQRVIDTENAGFRRAAESE